MQNSNWPLWAPPVAPGFQIANVTEMVKLPPNGFEFIHYATVFPKNGFGPKDWDRFILSED